MSSEIRFRLTYEHYRIISVALRVSRLARRRFQDIRKEDVTTYLRESIVERIERDDWATTVTLSGELDLWTIIELQDALEAECSSCPLVW